MSLNSLIVRACKQTAVRWTYNGQNGYGDPSYGSPSEISVRWAEESEVMKDSKGNEFVSNARILSPSDMNLKDRLFLGSLSDLTAEQQADPLSVSDAREIRVMEKKPEIGKEGYSIFEAWLGTGT